MSESPLKNNLLTLVKEYALVSVGVIAYALGWTIFLLPNNLVGGGVHPYVCDRHPYGSDVFCP